MECQWTHGGAYKALKSDFTGLLKEMFWLWVSIHLDLKDKCKLYIWQVGKPLPKKKALFNSHLCNGNFKISQSGCVWGQVFYPETSVQHVGSFTGAGSPPFSFEPIKTFGSIGFLFCISVAIPTGTFSWFTHRWLVVNLLHASDIPKEVN